MANDEFIIELVADSSGVIKAIKKQVEAPEVRNSGKTMGENLLGGFKAAGVGAGIGAAVLAGTAFVAKKLFDEFVGVMKPAIEAATVQSEAVSGLNRALAVTGQYSKQTSQDLQNFAATMEQTTRFGDEAVIKQIAFAQSMGATSEQSKQIVAAAADMATALNMDLNSAVRNVSKTLGGLAGELGESIPQLKNLTKEQMMAGEGITLIADRFKGFAELAGDTFVGKLEKLKNSWGSLKEALGSTVTESGIVLAIFDLTKKTIDKFISTTDFTPIVQAIKTVALAALSLLDSFTALATGTAKFFGSEGMTKFLAETNVAVRNLRQEINSLKADDIARFQQAQENALLEQNAMSQKMKQIAEIAEAERLAAEERDKIAKENEQKLANQEKIQNDFAKNLKTNFIGGITQGFEAMGAAFVNGGNGFEEFGKIALKTLGQLALQTGSFLILTGAGMSGVGTFLGLSGGAAIAAGIGLTILGGALMALSGGGGGKKESVPTATSSSAGGGLASSGAGGIVGEGAPTSFQGNEQMQKQAQVSLTVNGSIFDSSETGTRILNLLENEFDYKNGALSYA